MPWLAWVSVPANKAGSLVRSLLHRPPLHRTGLSGGGALPGAQGSAAETFATQTPSAARVYCTPGWLKPYFKTKRAVFCGFFFPKT